MRIIARKTLKEFWERHPDAEQPLKAWFKVAEQGDAGGRQGRLWQCQHPGG